MTDPTDIHYMQQALQLASTGLGLVAPNPSVGALVVKNGKVIGKGVTARGGRPHAEPQALAMAGAEAKGATLYVTLEPCSHFGKTPPCAQTVIDTGIVKVVCAVGDSNPLVAGKGIAMLRAAGIEVVEGICKDEARALNEGFFSVIERGRPFVTVKIATSQDGRTATLPGENRWITGPAARDYGHLLRATNDAILTGIGTVLADNPELNCRLPGREQDSPQRILLDTNLRIPVNAKLLPAWIFTSSSDTAKIAALEQAGARIFTGAWPLPKLLQELAKLGITRLMVEGGKTLTEAFLNEGLADRLYWFRAPHITGDPASVVAIKHVIAKTTEPVGNDMLEIYEIRKD